MYRSQFSSDRSNDHTTVACRPGRSGGTHHWVVSGGRGGSASSATRSRSPSNQSRRPGRVLQYRPRSPASVVSQGNAIYYTPSGSAAAAVHTQPASQGSTPSNVPDKSDAMNLESAQGERAADSSIPTEGCSSSALTLQFGTLSPGVINKQCTPCTTSPPVDLDGQKHEKEQQKQEATDDLIIGGRADSINKYDNVYATVLSNTCVEPELELPETPVRNYIPPSSRECNSCKVLPQSTSSPTRQQSEKEDTTKDATHANQSDTSHKYPVTKPKISVQIPASYTPNVAPPSFMLPVHGKPLPVAYQQKPPQVPIEFRGLGVQMQSIGSMPMGNAPHVQPLFVHGAPPRAFQQQAVIQQGQGLGCAHPASHHLPQFGNMRIIKDLSQQQARSCNEQKRIVKITHPETHEELMLDRYVHSYGYMDIPVPGQIPLPGMNQLPQTVQTFSPFHKVYPLQRNIYNSTPFYLHKSSTVPFESRQISSKMQPPRYSFDPTNSNRPIVPIKSPTPNPWLNVSSRPPTHSHASEVSSSKGILSSTLSAPGQGAQKLPTVFFAGKNEISSQTSTLCMTETPTVLRYSGESALPSQQRVHKNGLDISLEPEKVVSEGNLKVPAATSGMSPTTVSAQQTQVVPAIAGHVTTILGPQNLPLACALNCTSVVKSKSAEMEKSPMSATASSSDAKSEPSNIVSLQFEAFEGTETSSETVHAILTEASLGYNNIDGTPLVARNSKCDGKSILGKPPLTHTQETLAPKFSTSRTITEGLSKANPIYLLEKTSKTSSSVPLHIRDVAREDHIVNVEVKCSRTKEEQVNMTMPSACGSENCTDGNKLVRLHAHSESGVLLYPLVSIRDLPSSYKNKQSTSDTQTGVCEPENKLNDSTLDSEMMLNNITFINSTSSERKLMQENVDLEISNNCSAPPPPMVLTKKTCLNFKDKTAYGRRKKRQEMFPKSDGQKCFDFYNASGSLNENPVSFSAQEDVQSSSTVDIDENCTLYAEDTLTGSSNVSSVSQKPTDLLDSEDATDISTQRLGACGCKHINIAVEVSKDKYECNQKKLYSRDFLLAFAQNCVNLPEGFKIGFDIADAIMSVLVGAPYIVHTELHSNHARIKDRVSATSRVNRHMSSKSDEDKWRKHYLSPIPGRDTLPDTAGRPAFSSRDATQLAGHGSLRSLSQNHSSNSQYTGEILSRAMKEVVSQRSMSRGSVDERWQHRTNVQGIASASQVSIPVMHKAEKKYEIGKVSDEEEAKQRQLKAILNKLTPQNFEKLFEQVKDLNIDNIVTLTGVISQIFDKALMEPTFCEMYASFCSCLAGELPNFVKDDEKITFKRLLLNKCQEEFERGEKEQAEADRAEAAGGIKQSEGEREDKRLRARRRMLGNIRLIGELYKKKMLTERIMHECIKKLLGECQHPDEEDLEALCKLMCTIGEMIDHSKAKVHMEFYFDIIQNLSSNSKLSSRIRFMLEDVIDLRKNKWRQRRKIEGPKKIEELRRGAVKQKLGQPTRLGSSPNYKSSVTCISSVLRAGPPSDNSNRGSSASTHRGSSQVRAYGSHNANVDARYQPSNRTLPVQSHQRHVDKSIGPGPQSDLGREISLSGKPPVSNVVLPEVSLNSDYDRTAQNSRQSSFTGVASPATIISPDLMYKSSAVSKNMLCEARTFPEEVLEEKSILTIREFYSAKNEEEVALCMKELNAPGFYPSVVSLWINDSFERKDLERELLAKLLVSLCRSQENILSERQLLEGFQHVVSTLEDVVTDAPRATEFLGRIFARVILEDVVSLTEIGGLLQQGGAEGPVRLASEVLDSTLESIRTEKGNSTVDEIRAKSSLYSVGFKRPGEECVP